MRKKKIPLRMCLGCKEMRPKQELIRVVRDPKGVISLDLVGKKPGRGAYICRERDCLKNAANNRMLERSFGQKIEKEIYDRLMNQMNEGENNSGKSI